MDDAALFLDYRRTRSERAFAALVAAQIDLAYGVALRRVRDAHLAEDVTQAVFIILAEKAPMLPANTKISGWIFRTTHHVARNALRAVARRREVEREFAEAQRMAMVVPSGGPSGEAADTLAVIDLALAQLGRADQEAVLLKYYRGQSWAEIGATLGLSEEAARKRIHRSLARLRGLLPAGLAAAAFSEFVSGHAVAAAPAPLTACVLENLAVHTLAAAPHTSAFALAKGTLMAVTKAKLIGVAAAVLLVAVPAAVVISQASTPVLPPRVSVPPPTLLASAAPAEPTAPAPAPASALPFTIGPQTTHITGPLHDDGTIDYVAALNDRYGKRVTPENNGFIDWLKIVGIDRIGLGNVPGANLWTAPDGGMFEITGDGQRKFLQLCGAEGLTSSTEVWADYGAYLREVGTDDAAPKMTGARAMGQAAIDLADAGRRLWDENQYPHLAEFLNKEEVYLTRLDAAAEKPQWWMPAVANDHWMLVSVYWPPPSGRSSAWGGPGLMEAMTQSLCCVRALYRAKHGDFDGFLRDVVAVKRLARHAAHGASLFGGLTGIALEHQASRTISVAAASGIFNETQCKRLRGALEPLEILPELSESLNITERWIHLDIAACAATGRFAAGNKYGVTYPVMETIQLDAVDWDAVLKQINAEYDHLYQALEESNVIGMQQGIRPLALHIARANANAPASGESLAKLDGETREAYSARVANYIVQVWSSVTSLRGMAVDHRAAVLEGEMTRAVVAAAEYRAARGHWPEKLEELTPEFLKTVPRDIFSPVESPVKYQSTPAGVRVYSVGPNSIDDGGFYSANSDFDDIVVGVK